MYKRAYGIIETLAPLHVGATAGEESGNLNLIFRDQFTQTGIIPGSSLRGRFRSELRPSRQMWLEEELVKQNVEIPDPSKKEIVEVLDDNTEENSVSRLRWLEKKGRELNLEPPRKIDENYWYGNAADSKASGLPTEALIKFEYASLVWLPVFCPGQPIVWVSCPRLLKRYKRIAGQHVNKNGNLLKDLPDPTAGDYSSTLKLPKNQKTDKKKLFFNFGFLELDKESQLSSDWFPTNEHLPAVVVEDDEMGLIHDMALYRQSRVKLRDDEKVVDHFFNVEALPEGTILVFPIAIRETKDQETWDPFNNAIRPYEVYLGGLESIGFGNCRVTINGIQAGDQKS